MAVWSLFFWFFYPYRRYIIIERSMVSMKFSSLSKYSVWFLSLSLVIIAVYLQMFFGMTYFNIKGLSSLCKLFVWLSSGSLLFVFLMGKLYLIKQDSIKNPYDFLYLILKVFLSSGLIAILTTAMQVLIYYPSLLATVTYYTWLVFVGLFLSYDIKLGLLGVSLVICLNDKLRRKWHGR